MATSSRKRPEGVTTLASFQVSKVCESHSSARGAVHGASSGIVLAMSSSWRIAFSASTAPRGVGRHRAERARRAVARRRAVAEVDVVAGVVGREGVDADVLGQRGDVVLGGADELGAALGDDAAAEVDVEHAPAHAVARLEHDDRPAGGDEVARGGQAGEPGADDDDVGGARAALVALAFVAACGAARQRGGGRRRGGGADEPAARDAAGRGSLLVHGAASCQFVVFRCAGCRPWWRCGGLKLHHRGKGVGGGARRGRSAELSRDYIRYTDDQSGAVRAHRGAGG